MRSIICMALLIAGSTSAFAQPKNDLTCATKDVFDAGFHVVGNLTQDSKLHIKIEKVNGWTGNRLEYSQVSEIITYVGSNGCEHFIVDKAQNPETIIVISTTNGPSIDKLNGEVTQQFKSLSCEASAKFIEFLGCTPPKQ